MIDQRCQVLLSQLSEYIDGELEDAFCAEIERHLATCAPLTASSTLLLVSETPTPIAATPPLVIIAFTSA